MTRHSYEGIFNGFPAPGKLTVCDYGLIPFHDDLDFESYEIMGRPRREKWIPTRVNYEQKYVLLADILGIVRQEAGSSLQEIILNSRMPSWHRMPAALMGKDIFVVVDVDYETERLLKENISFITLYEGFIRHANEEGHNQLVLHWYRAPEDGGVRLAAMQARFAALGLVGEVSSSELVASNPQGQA